VMPRHALHRPCRGVSEAPAGVCGLSGDRRGTLARTVRSRSAVLDAACGSRSRWSLRALRSLPAPSTNDSGEGVWQQAKTATCSLPTLLGSGQPSPSSSSRQSRRLSGLRPSRTPRSQGSCRPRGQTITEEAGGEAKPGRAREGLRREACRSSLEAPGHGKPGKGERRQRSPCRRTGALAVHGIASQGMDAFLCLTATSPASPAGNLLHFCRFASKALMPSAIAGTHCTCTGLASPIYFLTHAS